MGYLEAAELDQNPSVDSGLRVEIVSDDESFAGLEPLWNRLLEESGINHPFLTHQWVRTWWECFGAGGKLHVLLVKDGDDVIAIAPLMLTRRKFYGWPLRWLEFIGNVHTPRCDFLVTRRPAEVYRAIWSSLLSQRGLWDVLLLCQLPDDSRTLDEIPLLAAESQLPLGQWRSAASPYLPMQEDWDGYFKQRNAKHRANLRRRLKRLSELGPVEMERITCEAGLEDALGEGFRIEGAAWKDQCGTSMQAQQESRLFYTKLARKFAQRGWLELNFLTVSGRRIAFHYSLRYNNKVYLLKPGYDPAYSSYSPVNLLCYLFLQHLFDTGTEEFDFLGVADEWKLQWTKETRNHYWLFVFSNSPLTFLIYLTKFRVLPRLQQKRMYGLIRAAIGSFRRNRKTARETL